MEQPINKKWEITTNRFVAFIDIMGFKDMIAKKTHKEIYSMLEEISDIGRSLENALINYGNNIKVFTFSDSIIVLSKRDDGIATFVDFSNAVSKIIGTSIFNGIPIKGGCAYGLISYNKEKNILCGKAFVDAISMEENLHYYGIACHHSIDKYFEEHNHFHKGMFLYQSKTTLKNSDVTHYNLDWFSSACEAFYESNKTFEYRDNLIKDKINNLYLQVSGKPRKYIDNTLLMYQRYLDKDPLFRSF